MTVVGVDGCKGRWFAVRLEPSRPPEWRLFGSVTELVAAWGDGDPILIDVPIGLVNGNSTGRRCDSEARTRLGPRGRSVFTPPCRDAVYQPDYTSASSVNHRTAGRGLSKQSWGIVRYMREVDEFLRAGSQARLREVHPELCFWAFNRGRPMRCRKTTEDGIRERGGVLAKLGIEAERLLREVREAVPSKSRVGDDDVLDALAAAATGLDPGRLVSIPAYPEWDDRGLRMEMVYRRWE